MTNLILLMPLLSLLTLFGSFRNCEIIIFIYLLKNAGRILLTEKLLNLGNGAGTVF